jgi:tetratricopeptide (TPR) repeat protein
MTWVLVLLNAPVIPCFEQERAHTAAESPRPTSSSHFEQAEALARLGKYAEAINEYQRELLDNPNDEAALFGMALAQAHLGRTSEAVQFYLQALRINPDLWEAELNVGILLTGEQDWVRALFHLERAQSLNPKSFTASFFAAKVQAQLEKSIEAEQLFSKALELASNPPEKFDVYAALGAFYVNQKNYIKAEQAFLQARELQLDTEKVDLGLAKLYYESRQYAKAQTLMQSLDSSHSKDPVVYALIGRLLAENKDNAGAAKAFERVIQLEPNPSRRQEYYLLLADIYQELGRPDEAIQRLTELVRTTNSPEVFFRIGLLRLHKRELDDAKLEFLQVIKMKPDYAEAYSNLGAVFMLQENYPDAIAAFSRFNEFKPDVPGTYFYLGVAYDKLGDYPNALANYGKFLELGKGQSDKLEFQARERSKILAKKMKSR